MPSTDSQRIEFSSLNARTVPSDFEGGQIARDGGVMLLGEVDRMYRVVERLADCFTDYRDAEKTEHPVLDQLRQRIYALCCGYEDLNDHDRPQSDTLLAAVIGKDDPEGNDRRREADRSTSLAGKSTLNRLELGKPGDDADSDYHKIVADLDAMEDLSIDCFSTPMIRRRQKSSSTWIPRTAPCTASNGAGIFKPITTNIVFCRCMFFAVIFCWPRGCGCGCGCGRAT